MRTHRTWKLAVMVAASSAVGFVGWWGFYACAGVVAGCALSPHECRPVLPVLGAVVSLGAFVAGVFGIFCSLLMAARMEPPPARMGD